VEEAQELLRTKLKISDEDENNNNSIFSSYGPSEGNKKYPNSFRCRRVQSNFAFSKALQSISASSSTASPSPSKQKIHFALDAIISGESTFFQIKILDVLSPSQFTIQFGCAKLDEFMEQLNEYYNELNLNDYKVENFQEMMLAAIRSKDDQRWYRAEINAFDNEKASLNLIDYMTVNNQEYLLNEIFYLDEKFATEPRKSINAHLYGIKPKDEMWNAASSFPLMELKGKDKAIASIRKKVDEIYYVTVVLVPEPFITVAQYLVGQQNAIFDTESLDTPSGFNVLE
jgi:hypothetical protein